VLDDWEEIAESLESVKKDNEKRPQTIADDEHERSKSRSSSSDEESDESSDDEESVSSTAKETKEKLFEQARTRREVYITLFIQNPLQHIFSILETKRISYGYSDSR
jgi:hypothetical protein